MAMIPHCEAGVPQTIHQSRSSAKESGESPPSICRSKRNVEFGRNAPSVQDDELGEFQPLQHQLESDPWDCRTECAASSATACHEAGSAGWPDETLHLVVRAEPLSAVIGVYHLSVARSTAAHARASALGNGFDCLWFRSQASSGFPWHT